MIRTLMSSTILQILSKITKNENKLIYLMGDFNINNINSNITMAGDVVPYYTVTVTALLLFLFRQSKSNVIVRVQLHRKIDFDNFILSPINFAESVVASQVDTCLSFCSPPAFYFFFCKPVNIILKQCECRYSFVHISKPIGSENLSMLNVYLRSINTKL